MHTRVTQPDIQAEWRPPPPATMTTISSASAQMGTRVLGLVWSIQLGQTRLPLWDALTLPHLLQWRETQQQAFYALAGLELDGYLGVGGGYYALAEGGMADGVAHLQSAAPRRADR